MQPLCARHVQLAVSNPRGNQQYFATDFAASRQLYDFRAALRTDSGDLLWGKDFNPKTPGLRHGAAGQISSAQARREAEIVFYTRAHSSLSAGRVHFHKHSVQALGRSVNGRRQACRAATDDHKIVERHLRPHAEPQFFGQLLETRFR